MLHVIAFVILATILFVILRWQHLTIGTRSVLIGAHCFFLHPFFVARSWWKLFGFPYDPRLWVAFFVHDLGYIGKPNMDGIEGEAHPMLGARIMSFLFDYIEDEKRPWLWLWDGDTRRCFGDWGKFSLLHSRYYAKSLSREFSRLCVADKLSFSLTPRWLYIPMVLLTGEIYEYLKEAKTADNGSCFKQGDYSGRLYEWHAALKTYMEKWVEEHKEGKQDTWTNPNRQRDRSGVTQ
jgi:hypothetical protein